MNFSQNMFFIPWMWKNTGKMDSMKIILDLIKNQHLVLHS